MTYHSLTQAGASVPAKELLESSEKSSFSGPLSQILNSMENAVISPMPGLVETTEGGSKASGRRCMLWVEHTSILHVLHVPAGRDTNPPPPSPTLHLSICLISTAAIWAALSRPNGLLQGSTTLCVSWLMQSSVGRAQESGLPCPPAPRAC